jgi:hypothetical protein
MNKEQYNEQEPSALEDYLKIFKVIKEFKHPKKDKDIHQSVNTLTEIAFYPEHDPRKETSAYKAVHKRLIKKEDRPCLICGVKNSTLGDLRENTYKAKALETHHCVIEWALMNAIDPIKFNKMLRPHLELTHPGRKLYKQDMDENQIKDWIDHDEDNLWVLCDVHHRSKFVGIHRITYPIWGPANLLRNDFEEYVRTQIEEMKGK